MSIGICSHIRRLHITGLSHIAANGSARLMLLGDANDFTGVVSSAAL